MLRPSGFRNSSSRISPGWIGGSFLDGPTFILLNDNPLFQPRKRRDRAIRSRSSISLTFCLLIQEGMLSRPMIASDVMDGHLWHLHIRMPSRKATPSRPPEAAALEYTQSSCTWLQNLIRWRTTHLFWRGISETYGLIRAPLAEGGLARSLQLRQLP
jgi:hypothetical protein